jgi:hypothetical protein
MSTAGGRSSREASTPPNSVRARDDAAGARDPHIETFL